ncbi:FAD-dependent monooxygenase [Amycolatopsis sp. FDAARGOS 1241]|uniref:FAD-dependent monooxygenase n=1 Tax=Amycolatopsis sp. FDAARGOS 1241 TaxID=2778070 RepID=UPI001951AF67|nr:FAD-dependent monooxygenase [Amycolatopsis sp. FDAARGOS 1241]QRP47665.1 FAD-dependent monooxygenase [Amycolatopsis sp. FDAARGOS 1241]
MPATDVVIAGAGPNGLMLACELRLAGVRPIVLERLTERSGEPRANGLVGQVVPLLHRRGLYEPLTGQSAPAPTPRYIFGAFPLDLSQLPVNPLYLLPIQQYELEKALEERALSLGVEIRRGHEVAGFTQGESVQVTIEGPQGPYTVDAQFLVGADGGRSTVRKLAGIDFPGVTWDKVLSYTVDVSVPDDLVDPASGGLRVDGVGTVAPFQHFRTETGLFVWAPFPNAPRRIAVSERSEAGFPDDVAPTLDEVRTSIRRVLGVDVPIDAPPGPGPHQLRRVTGGNTRIAERFRDGRVLLVGDAAHVHSAIGGPGLNLGLQDAANLAWKLAAEVRGWAPAGLLDTYDAERQPISRRVVMHTQAQGVLTGPGPEITALRELFGELLGYQDVRQHLADLLSGADLRYGDDPHPLVGRWAPDLASEAVAQAYRAARPVLVDLTADGSVVAAAEPWRDRVDAVATTEDLDATALLIRPDGYVAWASSEAQPDTADLEKALQSWFGAPVTTVAG